MSPTRETVSFEKPGSINTTSSKWATNQLASVILHEKRVFKIKVSYRESGNLVEKATEKITQNKQVLVKIMNPECY